MIIAPLSELDATRNQSRNCSVNGAAFSVCQIHFKAPPRFMKKGLMLLTLIFSLVLPSCGPNEAELRTEMHSIDRELMALRNAAYRYQSQMNQAEFAAFIGSFATGYGITSGEGELAGEGVGTVIDAASDYDVASFSLEQIKQRQMELLKRRTVIVAKLG